MIDFIREHNPKSIGTLLLVIVIAALFLTPQKIFAVENFTSEQNISYVIDQSGSAKVTHLIKLTNNYAQIYAKEYVLELPITINSQIQATDKSGNILKSVKNHDGKTSISLQFSQPSIGKDALTEFQISYDFDNLVTDKGNTKEIELPLSPLSDNTTINLKLPASFDHLAYSSLTPSSVISSATDQQIQYKYTATNAKKILLALGNHQLFDFQLSYFLNNISNIPVTKEIALPPTFSSQTVTFRSIDPTPSNIIADADGNWLARYVIDPQQKISIKVDGQVKITGDFASSTLPAGDEYTRATLYWPTSEPALTAIAIELKTPKSIYDYVVNNLSYDYNRINNAKRRGALNSFNNPQSSLCTDFTDLFVTLARINNIPAREIEGFAYSNNPKIKPINTSADILHAWPQYYEQKSKSWKSIDPTWAKTTNGIDFFSDLDLNHFAFVIHGLSDVYPLSPGSYRNNQSEKSVNVIFATNEIKSKVVPLKFTDNIIHNPNLFALTNVSMTIPGTDWRKNIDIMPPLNQTSLSLPSIPFPKILLPKSKSIILHISSDQLPTAQDITISNRDHYLYLTGCIAIAIIILTSLGIIITKQK